MAGGNKKIHEHPKHNKNGFAKNPQNINRKGRPIETFNSRKVFNKIAAGDGFIEVIPDHITIDDKLLTKTEKKHWKNIIEKLISIKIKVSNGESVLITAFKLAAIGDSKAIVALLKAFGLGDKNVVNNYTQNNQENNFFDSSKMDLTKLSMTELKTWNKLLKKATIE